MSNMAVVCCCLPAHSQHMLALLVGHLHVEDDELVARLKNLQSCLAT